MSRQSISAVITARARRSPQEVIAVDRTGSLSAGELDERANVLAAVLIERGVRRDDTVIVALPNSIDVVIICAAIWRAGATPLPLSPTLAATERAALVELAGPAAIFGDMPVPTGVAHIDVNDRPRNPVAALPDTWAHCWKAVTSSGSTGRPKIVRATAAALVDPDVPVAQFLPNDSVQLITIGLWHSAAFTYAFRGLTGGHKLIIEPAFDEFAFLAAVSRHQVSWALLSPPSIHRLVRMPEAVRSAAEVSSLRSVVHLGARCPVADKMALLDWLGPERVIELYAGSESNGLTMIGGSDWLKRPGSVGTGIGGTEIEIRDPGGQSVDAGVAGTIWMRRGGRAHYVYQGASSAREDSGWDTLGDVGYLDAEGYLYVLDRDADVIRRRGATVYPADVEQAIETHPAVRGAVAAGSANSDGTTTLTALVDVAGASITALEIIDFAANRLPAAARPDRVILTDKPLRNDAGKIRRQALITTTLPQNGAPQ